MGALAAPVQTPAAADVMTRARGENFPVAGLLLGRRRRDGLLALYGFARLVDELGDTFEGDRLAALDWAEGELRGAFRGEARHELFGALQSTVERCSLPIEPFLRLLEANRLDQRVSRYESWEQLRGYCHLSADPVGELVLGVFAAATPARVGLSDSICTALQLTEHLQDVAEDHARGRVYLPREDLERFGVDERELGGTSCGPRLRALIAFECERAQRLYDAGEPLLGELHGRERLCVGAFLAGGRSATLAIERSGCEVLGRSPRPSRALQARVLVRTLARRSR